MFRFFYAEAGGKVADTGLLETENREKALFNVKDFQLFDSFLLHIGSNTAMMNLS